jgi:hypothetical protein
MKNPNLWLTASSKMMSLFLGGNSWLKIRHTSSWRLRETLRKGSRFSTVMVEEAIGFS